MQNEYKIIQQYNIQVILKYINIIHLCLLNDPHSLHSLVARSDPTPALPEWHCPLS
jgi:hypothetical protein